jgi:hypothetical protein
MQLSPEKFSKGSPHALTPYDELVCKYAIKSEKKTLLIMGCISLLAASYEVQNMVCTRLYHAGM